MLEFAPVRERSHRGLVQRFAKPPSGVTCFEGSNPSLSASPRAASAPVAQWIERQVADLKVVGSSPAGRAKTSHLTGLSGGPLRLFGAPVTDRVRHAMYG